MKIQIKVTVFKPSGKYYTEDFAVVEATFIGGDSTPANLYHYDIQDRVKEYFKGKYTGMIIHATHELMVPFLLMM